MKPIVFYGNIQETAFNSNIFLCTKETFVKFPDSVNATAEASATFISAAMHGFLHFLDAQRVLCSIFIDK